MQVRGQFQSRDITAAGNLNVSGQLGAQTYFAWDTQAIETIYGVTQRSLSSFRKQINKMFSSSVRPVTVTYP